MRKVLFSLTVACLVAAAFVTAVAAQTAQDGPEYLALGDSLAVGVGASDQNTRGYVPLLFPTSAGVAQVAESRPHPKEPGRFRRDEHVHESRRRPA